MSQQDADEKAGDAAAKQAATESAAANVARLQDLESFKRVVAPFDGVVTQRNTDVGALINAGQITRAAALFRVADTQQAAHLCAGSRALRRRDAPGMEADLHFTEHPGQSFRHDHAHRQRPRSALRTLQVELQVDNANGELFPGAYAEVHFKLPGNPDAALPANTLLFRAAGLQVATVDSSNHVKLKSIVPGARPWRNHRSPLRDRCR